MVTERAVETIAVAADPETVFSVAVDLEDYPEWVKDLKSVVVTEKDPEGRPLVATFRAAAFGRSSTYTLRYDYGDAPTRALVGAWSKVTSPPSWTAPTGSSRRTAGHPRHLPARGRARVPIPGFVKQRAAQQIQRTALQELKARAESLV